MAKVLDMPKLSPTMEEGVLATWHKKEGDKVEVDDLLAEVETDKATMEFRAFDQGTILKLLVEAGANVKLGQPVAILGSPGEDISGLAGGGAEHDKRDKSDAKDHDKRDKSEEHDKRDKSDAKAKGKADHDDEDEPPAETPRSPNKERRPAPDTMRPAAPLPPPPPPPVHRHNVLMRTAEDPGVHARSSGGPSANGERVLASPHVRRIARERGIDLSAARGSGEHGRIVPEDLEGLQARTAEGAKAPAAHAASPSAHAGSAALAPRKADALATPALAQPEARPLSQMRKAIARRLTQAKQTVPHFYLTIDVDASALVALREKINAELGAPGAVAHPKNAKNGEAAKPEKISLNDLIVKASAAGLRRVPECNAQFTDEAILVHTRVDISVAVAVPDGLLTPVVRNADQKSVVAIAREVRELASRARSKKLKPEEMSEGTFSISNLGMFGIDEFSAVINPPEGAILAVGQVRDEPVVRDGAVVPGKRLSMTLSCDHRVVDGAIGAAFLAELRDLIEHPMRILTG